MKVEDPLSFNLFSLCQILFFYLFLFVMLGGLYILKLRFFKKAVFDPKRSLERALIELEDPNRELDYTHQELETFAYSISHGLWTLLSRLYGYTELLLAEPSGSPFETRRHYLERIQLTAQKMSRLVNGLLLLTKINLMQLVKANVNLGMIARDYAKKQKEYFKKRMFEL